MRGIVVWMVMASNVIGWANSREPELHYVGGSKFSWSPNTNFSSWSSSEHFYVGDWLYFGFDKYRYNVLEVNKTSYEQCIEADFIKNITKGGRDVFELKEAKPYYFISGFGYCFQGMKVAINVLQAPPSPPPKMAPSPNSSSRITLIRVPLFALLISIILFMLH